MKVVFVINKEAWALGTLARLFKLVAPPSWQVESVAYHDIVRNPGRFAQAIEGADVVHWMVHREFCDVGSMTKGLYNVVMVNHIMDDEKDLSFLSSADALTVSSICVDRLLAQGLDRGKITTILYPVESGFFPIGAKRMQGYITPAAASIARIGFFCSAEYESNRKGIDLLPEILAELEQKGVRCEIMVTGLGWDRILCQSKFKNLPIRREVAPSYFDMPQLYRDLDCYLCVSRVEGGPMPVFEAAACGVPIVSTIVGNVGKYLEPEKSYLSVPFDNPATTANQICRILSNRLLAFQLGLAAYNTVSAAFDVRLYGKTLVELYARQAKADVPTTLADCSGARAKLMKRGWRAWDRTYWAKELWKVGEYGKALQFMIEAVLLNPLCRGIWNVPARMIGLDRVNYPRVK